MKKFLCLVLTAVLVLSLFACGKKDDRTFTYSVTEPWGVRTATLLADGTGTVSVEGDGSSFAKNKKAYRIAYWEIKGDELIVEIYSDDESRHTTTDTFSLSSLPEGLRGIETVK